ncbi:MAG: DUF1553 domain-containing protein [Planctomycetaceae bacterium]|nr:DUF1553 domain-containing protein [Planctomycetaceae bacterium]
MRSALLVFATMFFLVGEISVGRASADEPRAELDFNRDIRPILSNHCFRCHGPDEAERAGGGAQGLRLDTPDGLREDLGGHFAVVPGQPDSSELLARVSSDDDSLVMPPPEVGVRLTPAEIARLRQWIAEGAVYSQHWAYVVPQRPAVPDWNDAAAQAWIKNSIDHFVWQRLRQENLVPQPEADRYVLIRRVALDVTGLPPTWDEVQQFVNDTSPNAYEQMVDRFLAKDAYGEHWARMWLDLARYADSAGYADDPARTIWAYRDYVIRAFNQNMPFDQFTIEQIAGDLLPNPTSDQLIATAFHRNTLTNNEGGTNDEEFRNVAVVDRVNTTYAVWMGTTMACAQCHTHKYDPLTHAEYFQSFAIFNNSEDADRGDESPLHEVWTESQLQERQRLQMILASDEALLQQMTPALQKSLESWETTLPQQPQWRTLNVLSAISAGDIGLSIDQESKAIRSAQGVAKDNFEIELDLGALNSEGSDSLTAIQLEALADASLPGNGPGWSGGNFVLSELRAIIVPPANTQIAGKFVRIELPGSNRILSLAEVEVLAQGQNVATQGSATQSSTAFEGAAQRAIDGNTNGHYFEANSVTHSIANETDPWWEVALADVASIQQIVVWNRTDGGASIMQRLQGARVKVLDEERRLIWESEISDTSNPSVTLGVDGSRPLSFAAAFADFNQDGFNATNLLAKPIDLQKGWAVGGATGRDHQLTLVLAEPAKIQPGSRLHVTLFQQSPHSAHLLGKFRLQATTDETITQWASIPPQIQAIVRVPAANRSPQQVDELAIYYRSIAPELEDVRQRVAQTHTQLVALQPTTTVPVMRELPQDRQRVTKIHNRGNFMDLGDEVPPGIPVAFANKNQPVQDRLALARWLVSRDNPLTARVTVNRHWEQLFGTGIVATTEEFGAQGDLPTHPELLDWLAVEFMERGWDQKGLLKTLLMSATYRQNSKVSRELADMDPENRLLARGPRFRLPAETIRDQSLAVAGLLSPKLFGPPVKPPQPALGLAAAFGSSTDWQTSSGEDRYRRGIYTTMRRSNPYPSMSTFDAPNREVCTLRRIRTNTPLQALVTLNDPVYIEAAQAFGRRLVQHSGTIEEKLNLALNQALSRPATADEIQVLKRLHEQATAALQGQPNEATKLATEPLGPAPAGSDIVELAAWTVVANAILNLDEFLMRR